MTISGFVLTGAKFGWMMNYALPAADFIHRTFAPIFVVLTLVAIVMEIYRCLTNGRRMPWLIIGSSGYQLFTLLTALGFILTGILIWTCNEDSKAVMVFAYTVHELLAYIVVVTLIWHIYQKSHALHNKTNWFKLLAWILASFFFFVAAALIISNSAGASEAQLALWMSGMMQTMHGSMMGVAMANEHGLQALFYESSSLVLPMVVCGAVLGLVLWVWRENRGR